jgi:hypothetical protein
MLPTASGRAIAGSFVLAIGCQKKYMRRQNGKLTNDEWECARSNSTPTLAPQCRSHPSPLDFPRAQQTAVLQSLIEQFPTQANREIISENRDFQSSNREFYLQL